MLRFQRLFLDSPTLERPSNGDAGYDLRAYQDVFLVLNRPTTIDTGIAIEIPSGYVGLIFPRSGLRFNHSINTYGVGVIDSSYRGEIKVSVIRHDSAANQATYMIKSNDKIAQLVIVPCFTDEIEEVTELSVTARDIKGFGSTGR